MHQQAADNATQQQTTAGYWLTLALTYLLFTQVIFISAWDYLWWQAWVFSLFMIVAGVGARVGAERRYPGLMADRIKFGRGQEIKKWDRILSPLMGIAISFPLFIVAGLDHRYGWTASFPVWVNLTGLLIVLLGYGFASWGMIENRYFTSMVRIQVDRGHQVCDSGPYRIVRHPGYAGNMLPMLGIVLALNSLWTIMPALFAVSVIVIRTVLEDRFLNNELPGYADYAKRVHYRLLPGIW